tara:strand:- start:513 stop:671 length:159 start_codon:yes stop_codon:yes gene_type:complete
MNDQDNNFDRDKTKEFIKKEVDRIIEEMIDMGMSREHIHEFIDRVVERLDAR